VFFFVAGKKNAFLFFGFVGVSVSGEFFFEDLLWLEKVDQDEGEMLENLCCFVSIHRIIHGPDMKHVKPARK
jgi:hypothetical protein